MSARKSEDLKPRYPFVPDSDLRDLSDASEIGLLPESKSSSLPPVEPETAWTDGGFVLNGNPEPEVKEPTAPERKRRRSASRALVYSFSEMLVTREIHISESEYDLIREFVEDRSSETFTAHNANQWRRLKKLLEYIDPRVSEADLSATSNPSK